MKSLEIIVERIILSSRWLLVVFYLGLVAALPLRHFLPSPADLPERPAVHERKADVGDDYASGLRRLGPAPRFLGADHEQGEEIARQ